MAEENNKKTYSRRAFLGVSGSAAIGGVVGGIVMGGLAGYFAAQTTQPPPKTVTVGGQTITATVTQTVKEVGEMVGRRLSTAVVVPGRSNDVGWNQRGVDSLRKAAQKFRADFYFSENLGYGEAPLRAMQDYIRRGVDLVFAHASGYRTQVIDIVKNNQNGKTKFLIVAAKVGEDLVPGALATYNVLPAETAYAAGYLAGLVTRNNVIGIVQSVETSTFWLRTSGGFVQGVKAANPNARVLFSVLGTFEDAVKGKEFTLGQIDQGADVIFGLGDGATYGMLEAVSERNVWFIDVIGDKRAVDTKGIILTSVLWDFTPALEEAIADIYNGTFGRYNYDLSIKNNAIQLMEINKKISADIRSEVAEIVQKLQDGNIKVRLTSTTDEFYALMRELGYR